MTEENVKTKKPAKAIERVTINDEWKVKLEALTAEANTMLDGIATVTKTDVVNILLSCHSEKLSSDEVRLLKETHVNPVKAAAWVSRRMKEAAKAGENLSIHELYERCMATFGPSTMKTQRRERRRKVKETRVESVATENPPEDGAVEAPPAV